MYRGHLINTCLTPGERKGRFRKEKEKREEGAMEEHWDSFFTLNVYGNQGHSQA
jgi:hypothetical protein